MATKFLFSSFFIVVILSSYFATICFSNKFSDENYIRLISDGQPDQNILDDSPFLSLPVNIIYQFGDSLSDTGNLIRIDPFNDCAKWPYGESFFDKPTGRCSDGLLMIDFFDRRRKISKGLFIMGEIGGNDYNFAFLQGKTLADVYKMVPDVIQSIKVTVEEIIDLGATQITIPGNFPIGCVPIYLSLFKTNDSHMYDELKCLKEYNKLVQFHNDQIQKTILSLKKSYPNVSIIYMDYYGTFRQILGHATLFGFDESLTQEACCGVSDDEYKVRTDLFCGTKGVPVCENPQEHISWDGMHLTQHTYHVLAKHLMPSLNGGIKNERVYGYLISIICLILIWGL
ncbi:hypothetical protein RND81_07G061500 [Saponaria officinalis]|uniref:Uncharacterized protein n=1 Tax=Saponaria officinalis TaxID=3572 RepID=A0AAW1JNS4_SAPOF